MREIVKSAFPDLVASLADLAFQGGDFLDRQIRSQLRRLSCFLLDQIDQFIFGSQGADLMLLEQRFQFGTLDIVKINKGLVRFQQLDKIRFGAGNPNLICLGYLLHLLDGQFAEIPGFYCFTDFNGIGLFLGRHAGNFRGNQNAFVVFLLSDCG